jgi:MtN3 and saliva related transmembrane protein
MESGLVATASKFLTVGFTTVNHEMPTVRRPLTVATEAQGKRLGQRSMTSIFSFLTEYREYVGFLAGILGTIALLPQVLKTVRERRTHDISLSMYALYCAAVAMWLLYGLLLSSLPMIIFNTITLLLAAIVLWMKIKNG